MSDAKYVLCAELWNNEVLEIFEYDINCLFSHVHLLVRTSFLLYGPKYKKIFLKKRIQADPVYKLSWKTIVEFYETGYEGVYRPQIIDNESEVAKKVASDIFKQNRLSKYF